MHKTPATHIPHPAMLRARRLTGRRGPRPLVIPVALNLGHATVLAAALLGLSVLW